LKKYELESFLKSFWLFFISITILVGALFYLSYQKELQTLDTNLASKMRICSYTLDCKEFEIDFKPKQNLLPYKLYKSNKKISSYYPIPNSQKNFLELYILKKDYEKTVNSIKNKYIKYYIIITIIIIVLSILFSFYTLYPLKKALILTQEFSKDILHDFNTPLSTIRLNLYMLKQELGENKKITRIENSLTKILNLQENLKIYLKGHKLQKETFFLDEVIKESILNIEKNYPDISYDINLPKLKINTNKNAFKRIIDNLISNASKYNKKDGKVQIFIENSILHVKDNGKGIKNPSKVFERFYKEQERGIGIGLHIVKKLCNELGIKISLKSKINKGSDFYLDLKNLINQ